MTEKVLMKVRAVDRAAERAGGYVMEPAKVGRDPRGEQEFAALRRYCIERRVRMSELTSEEVQKALV